jgi:hypothetical protein
MILRLPTERDKWPPIPQALTFKESVIPACFKRESSETGAGPPIKTFGGDTFWEPFLYPQRPIFNGVFIPKRSLK